MRSSGDAFKSSTRLGLGGTGERAVAVAVGGGSAGAGGGATVMSLAALLLCTETDEAPLSMLSSRDSGEVELPPVTLLLLGSLLLSVPEAEKRIADCC